MTTRTTTNTVQDSLRAGLADLEREHDAYMAELDQEDEIAACPGHESTVGPAGIAVYCDGRCQRARIERGRSLMCCSDEQAAFEQAEEDRKAQLANAEPEGVCRYCGNGNVVCICD
jgi:hypothetical protein